MKIDFDIHLESKFEPILIHNCSFGESRVIHPYEYHTFTLDEEGTMEIDYAEDVKTRGRHTPWSVFVGPVISIHHRSDEETDNNKNPSNTVLIVEYDYETGNGLRHERQELKRHFHSLYAPRFPMSPLTTKVGFKIGTDSTLEPSNPLAYVT